MWVGQDSDGHKSDVKMNMFYGKIAVQHPYHMRHYNVKLLVGYCLLRDGKGMNCFAPSPVFLYLFSQYPSLRSL